MKKILIKNGRIIDPENNMDQISDLLISDQKIEKIGKNLEKKNYQIFDAKNHVVFPGIIDLHAHFREPGREDAETLETASQAALAGGICTACAMPNSGQTLENQNAIEFIKNRSSKLDLIDILPIGAISKNLQNETLSEMCEMAKSGAIGFSDDGRDIQSSNLLLKAFKYAYGNNFIIFSHCEDEGLSDNGVLNEGKISTKLGLPGISVESEVLAVFKNIILAEKIGTKLHLLHNSTKKTIEIIRSTKKSGNKNITAEAVIHNCILTEEECDNFNTLAKINPPLRTKEDIVEIIKALNDGTIDTLATDHAPHIEPHKNCPFFDAAFGTIGFETFFSAVFTFLISKKQILFSRAIELVSKNPAKILNEKLKGNFSTGSFADIAIFNPKEKWQFKIKNSFSKGQNCVWENKNLIGKITATFRKGKLKFKNGRIIK